MGKATEELGVDVQQVERRSGLGVQISALAENAPEGR
jgi:hypothetical protein